MWKKLITKAVTSILQELLQGIVRDIIDQRINTLGKIHRQNKRVGAYANDRKSKYLMDAKIATLKEVSDVIVSATER